VNVSRDRILNVIFVMVKIQTLKMIDCVNMCISKGKGPFCFMYDVFDNSLFCEL
jgi:hypothetical protein